MSKRKKDPPNPWGGSTAPSPKLTPVKQQQQNTANPWGGSGSSGGVSFNPAAASLTTEEPKHRAWWNIPSQAGDLATGVFSGIGHMTTAGYRDLDSLVADTAGSLGNLPHPSQWFGDKDPLIRSWAHPGSAENMAKYPLTSQQLSSMRDTVERNTQLAAAVAPGGMNVGETQWADRVRKGQLLATIVQDAANASIVAGPTAKLVGGLGGILDAAKVADVAEVGKIAEASSPASVFAERAGIKGTPFAPSAEGALGGNEQLLFNRAGPVADPREFIGGAKPVNLGGRSLAVTEGADPGVLSQAGAKLGTASHLGAKVAGGPATVWTAIPGFVAKGIRTGGELTGWEAAAQLPTFTGFAKAAGEAIAEHSPDLEKQFPRLTEKGRNVVSMVQAGRMEAGQATREARIAYDRSAEASMPSKAEARALLEDQGVKPTRSEVRDTRRQEAIINQQAGSMIRDQTAVPLTTLPEGTHPLDMAEAVTGKLTEEQQAFYAVHPQAAVRARSYLMGTLDPETVAKIDKSMQPMSRLSRIRQAAGLERGTIHPSQTGWDYMRPAGPAGQEVQQAMADELHSAYKAHVQETGAENVTLQDLYPKMAERYKEVTGEDYTPEKYAADVHTLAESEVTGSRSGAAMTLTGSGGHVGATPDDLAPAAAAPGVPKTQASFLPGVKRAKAPVGEVVTHEASAWERPSYYGVKFGEETAIPKRLRPEMGVWKRVHDIHLATAADETATPLERANAAKLAAEVPHTLEDMAAYESSRLEAGYRGDVQHLIGGGAKETAGTSAKGQGGPFAKKVRKFGEQTQAETTLTQRGSREQAILDSNRRTQFIRDKNATDIGNRYGADPEVEIGPEARKMRPDKLETEMEKLGKVKLQMGAGKVAWVDPVVKAAFDKEWKDPGQQFGVKLLSKGNRMWKTNVLPLSPRWHIGNVVGNMLMATVGAGVDPVTLAKHMLDVRNTLKYGDPNELPARLTTSSIAEGERRAMRYGGVADEGGRLKQTIQKSYAFNSTVDEMFRSAVYLAKKGEGFSEEEAIRAGLKTMGDFDRMTPFERNYIREVMPFYSWARHITQLTLRLPVENPMRVAWMLHLSDQYADDQSVLPAFLKGSMKIAGRYLPASNLNPFSTVLPTDITDTQASPFLNPASFGSALSPFLKVPAQMAYGWDLSHGGKQTTRSESMGGRDPRGTLKAGPLPLTALPNLIINQVPLARLARDIVPLNKIGVQSWGTPGARLNSGEPYMQGGERVAPLSIPEAAARALLPWPRKVTQEEIDAALAQQRLGH